MHKFNERAALWLTNKVGSMGAAYLFALLACISLPAALMSGSALIIVAWIAQTFLQLVLLPVIMVGQNLQSAIAEKRANEHAAAADARSKETHDAVMEELRVIREMHEDLAKMVNSIAASEKKKGRRSHKEESVGGSIRIPRGKRT